MVFLGRGCVNVLFCGRLSRLTNGLGFLSRSVCSHERIAKAENSIPVVSLPEGNILKTESLKCAE